MGRRGNRPGLRAACRLDLRSHQGQRRDRPRGTPTQAGRASLTEREEFSRGLARGESLRQIASVIGRSVSTVSREVTRKNSRQGCRTV
ncbi:helix-turn-helix domain-containing protein [Streptomyces sp. NPDC096339]|uniref:helix-turn-helix domain-containing protein n=1 Tax=Streptomyces sp. NPDC096339 TaxID=3366086 RepID=UPI0037FAD018